MVVAVLVVASEVVCDFQEDVSHGDVDRVLSVFLRLSSRLPLVELREQPLVHTQQQLDVTKDARELASWKNVPSSQRNEVVL